MSNTTYSANNRCPTAMSGVPADVSVERTYEVVLKMLLVLMAAKLLIVVIQSILTEMVVSFVFAMAMGKAFPSSDTTKLWDSIRKNEEWCKQLLRILRDGSRKPPTSSLRPMKRLKAAENSLTPSPSGFVMIEGEVMRSEPLDDSDLPTYEEFMKDKNSPAKCSKFFSNLVDAFRFVTKEKEVVREKFVALPKVEGKVVYYVFDIETTGMSKTADRIIELSAIAVNARGDVYGKEFSKRIGTTVPINPRAQAVHGISAEDLETELDFSVVGVEFVTWMESFLGDGDVGVLVAHNGDSCDFQFLCAEMWRWGVTMPKDVRYTLDTLSVVREYKDIPYCPNAVEKLGVEEWPERTATGLPRLTCSAIVNVLLKDPKRIALRGRKIHLGLGEGTFDTVCGVAHSALADAVGCAVVMFDKRGMEPKLAKGRVYGEVRSHWDKVVGKMSEARVGS